MERSRKRTPMIYRSKAVCAIALAVGFGCAVFGVGGAGAGDGAYVHHLQQVRLENLALAHRSPEQLVLAMKPKLSSLAATDTTTAPATTTTAATTTAPATTDTATTAATTTSTTPAPTTTDATTTATTTTPTTTTTTSTTNTSTTPTATTTTGTTTTGTTTTPTTTTGTTTTGTTTTGTTTTGTTTTGTTTTDTTTTGTPDATSSPVVHGRQPGTTGSGSTTQSCHGRCDGLTGSSGVVPASLPSSSSSSTSSSFSLGSVTTPLLAAPTAPVNDSSSSGAITPVSSTPPAPTPAPAPTPIPTTTPEVNLLGGLQNIIKSSSSAINDLTHGNNGSGHSTATLPTATGGTGGTTAGTGGGTGTGPAGAATAGTAAAAAATNITHTQAHRTAKKQPSSGGSGLPIQIPRFVDRVVNHIPTLVWIALGGAFALALVFAGLAFRSGRRARSREKEFAAISAAALTDALTGILNRRGFTEAAERELARASRYDRPFVLAYVDVRGLKTVNDTEGHLMGDELIKTVAGLMKESARADDVVGRIGGDEFALLLGEQTAESAGPVVRRIQAHVAEARAATEISVPWELTIGMASFPDDGATLEELLDVADRRLYEQRGIALR